MNFGDLATFPMEDDDWIVTVLIGGVLAFLGFLLVPILVVWGYLIEVMRGGLEGSAEPPSFDDWGEMAKDGLFGLIIMFVYQIIPMVVLIGLTFVSGGLMATGSEAGAGLGLLGFLLSYVVYFALFLVFIYVGAAGVVNYAREGTIGAGFDFGVITPVVTSGEWLKAFLFYFVMLVVANVLSIFVITAPFVSFYALSASSRGWGEAFASASA